MSAAVKGSLLRSVSVSSMRNTKRPPWWRANSQLNNAVRALPRCSSPVGLGAKRVVMGHWDTGGFYGIESPPMKKLTLLPALLGFLLAVQSQAANIERVRVTTNLGEFVIEMQRDRAPLTVENFLNYVRADGYRNTLIHRVIANFVIQGGGVTTEYKAAPTQKQISNEAGNGLKNLRGTVGLARERSALGRSPVLRQRRRQRRSRPPAHALGLRRVRPRGRRHGSRGPHQCVAHGRDGAVQAGSTDAGGPHPEDRAADRWRDACGQACSRGRTDGNTGNRTGRDTRNATGNAPGHAASETGG
jgi:hypothetical protein